MSKLLLTQTGELALTLCLVFAFLTIGTLILVFLKKKYGADEKTRTKNEPVDIPVSLNKTYMTKGELSFYKAVLSCLPIDFICFPKVSVARLVVPKQDKNLFNTILNEYVDVAIFLRDTMEPVLAIDLYDKTNPEKLAELPTNIKTAFSNVKLDFIQVEAQDSYSIDELRKKIISAMPAKIMAQLKEYYKEKGA